MGVFGWWFLSNGSSELFYKDLTNKEIIEIDEQVEIHPKCIHMSRTSKIYSLTETLLE